MNDNTIDGLRAALALSPENVPLRLLLADTLLSISRLEEAEQEYSTVLTYSAHARAKVGLAKVFFQKGSYSACIVILEEIIEGGSGDIEVLALYAKGLLKKIP